MTSSAIEQSVLSLPRANRVRLLHLLLKSLDEPSETDIQQLWMNEAQRRAGEIDSGKRESVSGEDLERQVQALFK